MYTLRPYQMEACAAAWKAVAERTGNPCIVLPTGTGKSLVIAELARQAVEWGGRVLVLAHVKELLSQNAEKIQSLLPGIEVGIYSAGLNRRDTSQRIVVAGIQSVAKRAEELGKFQLIIVDECHLIPLDGYGRYLTFLHESRELYGDIDVIGLTATPYRLDGGDICGKENIIQQICYSAPMKSMVDMGYLSRITPYRGDWSADFSGVAIKAGEFDAQQVEKEVMHDGVTETACRDIVKKSEGRKAILIFGTSIAHCHLIRETIEAYSGEECALIEGGMPSAERAEIIQRIRGGNGSPDLFGNCAPPLRWLVNCGVLTTGFDAPRIDCIAVLRPTMSASLFVQMVGRGSRLCDGKTDCLLLDYGGNVMRHGTIDEINQTPMGMGEKKKKKGNKAKECNHCSALVPKSAFYCPYCGNRIVKEDIDIIASDKDPMNSKPEEIVADVLDVIYESHVSRLNPDNPPTLQISYKISLYEWVKEWMCPGHMGYAREKFIEWWRRFAAGDAPVPNSADEAMECINQGLVGRPPKIRIAKKPGEKYYKIVEYVFYSESEIDELPF